MLVGRPAVILAIPPYFSLTLDENSAVSTDLGGPENKRIPFSPPSASPAGKVLESIPVENISNLVMNWSDPFFGAGGFGGSTAEFAFASYIAGDRTAEESLERYLFIHENGTLPSGADLFTQWYGGAVLFQARRRVKDLTENCEGLSCLIFSASHLPGRKVVTHSHLEKLNLPGLDGLGPSVENAIAALEKKDLVSLGETFTHFARVLNGLGFESEAAKADRLAFAEIDGVYLSHVLKECNIRGRGDSNRRPFSRRHFTHGSPALHEIRVHGRA